MAKGDVIGSLRVALGIDSAQFDAGIKQAQMDLAKFGKQTAVVGAAIAGAFGVGLVGGIKRLEEMRKLSAQLDKALANTGNTAKTSAAEVAKFADKLEMRTGRAAEEIMAISTNLATYGFGREVFFEAIELADDMAAAWGGDLRQNVEGLARALAEPEKGLAMLTKRGITFDEQQKAMIASFMKVNDLAGAQGVILGALNAQVKGVAEAGFTGLSKSMARVAKSMDDVFEQVAEGAYPALESLADLLASPEVARAAETLGTTMVQAFELVVQAVVATTNAIKGFLDWLNGMDGANTPLLNKLLPGEKANLADSILAASGRANSPYPIPGSSLYAGFGFGADGKMLVQPPDTTGLTLPTFGSSSGSGAAAKEAMDRRLEALRESLRTEEESEKASFARRAAEIQKFYDDNVIKRDEYDDLMLRAQEQHADAMLEITRKQAEEEARIREQLVDNAAGIFGSLATIAKNFGEKNLGIAKAFGVAEAVVNTAQGVTKALAQGGVLGFAGAAAVAAAGAAQISTILSASPGSSGAPSVSSSTAAVSAPEQATPSSTVNVTLQGRDGYTRDQIRELLDSIADYSRDGSMIRVMGV